MGDTTSEWLPLIISTGVLSGAVSAILTQFLAGLLDIWKDNKRKNSESIYGSSRLATILEEFALDCVRAVQDTRDAIGSDGHLGSRHSFLPELKQYPSDIKWESIDQILMDRILATPVHINQSNGYIKAYAEYVYGSPDYEKTYIECTHHCILRGYQALTLARNIRSKHPEIKESSLDEYWVQEFLESEYPDIQRMMEERNNKAD